MLITDLDDTIFQTSSMNPRVFDSAINVIIDYYDKDHSQRIIDEIWLYPIDIVFSKYKTPKSIINEFYHKISEINYNDLDIKTYDDYPAFLKLRGDKILVTTGLKELQNAKIDALGIRNDFINIYIDDPRTQPRFGKYEIFSDILNSTYKEANKMYVIGDNPDSEIEAAHRLGINSIQRSSKSKVKSELADFYIDSFYELSEIIN